MMAKVVLGAMEIGRSRLTEEVHCFELLDLFLQKGGYEIDTALLYAGGTSEKILGKYLSEKGIRDQVVIDTKINPFHSPLTKENVLQQAQISMESLRISCMDIFYLHAPDHTVPLEETLEAVQQLYNEGKFKEFGLSNYASWLVAEVYHICKENGWVLPTVYQGMYNPITRMVEAELFPALRKFGLRFYAYNPLAGGLLSGRYRKDDMDKKPEGRFWSVGGPRLNKLYQDRFWRESVFDGVELVRQSLDEVYGQGQVSLVSATFRWMNHHSLLQDKDAIIIGCGSKEHLIANMDACQEGPLDPRVVEVFNKAWNLDKANCSVYFR